MSPNLEYKQALVTYVDVLGFAEFVKSSEKPPFNIAEIRRILQILRTQLHAGERFKYEGEKPPEPLFRAFSFSDLTVRVTLIDPEKDFMNILNREIQILADRQLELACWGADERELFPVLLRGAISVGSISMDPQDKSDELVFGPALVRSYKLEHETAVFPRIVIDRKLLIKANEHDGMLYRQFIKRGDDGIDFIDYLCRCNEFYETEEPLFNNSSTTLANHKKMIERTVARLKSSGKASERVIQKYLWLANYHNSTVSELPVSEKEPAAYGIPDDEEEVGPDVYREELFVSDDLFNL